MELPSGIEMTQSEAARTPPATADQLVRDFYDQVWHFAQSILDSDEDADDIDQETLVVAMSSLSRYRGEAAFKTWLFSIALNLCRRHYRKMRSGKTLSIALRTAHLASVQEAAPEEVVTRRDTDRRLWAAVDSLEEDQRLVIVMRYAHELAVREIAFIMKTKEATIHTRLHRARTNLQRLLGGRRDGGIG